MDEIPCTPGKVAVEALVGLCECLQELKSKPSQSERLPECIMGKKKRLGQKLCSGSWFWTSP